METLAFVAVFGAITAALAARKGYNPVIWFFTAGILGMIILAFLPFTNKGDLKPEEAMTKRKRGNIVGGVIVATAIGLGLLRLFLM